MRGVAGAEQPQQPGRDRDQQQHRGGEQRAAVPQHPPGVGDQPLRGVGGLDHQRAAHVVGGEEERVGDHPGQREVGVLGAAEPVQHHQRDHGVGHQSAHRAEVVRGDVAQQSRRHRRVASGPHLGRYRVAEEVGVGDHQGHGQGAGPGEQDAGADRQQPAAEQQQHLDRGEDGVLPQHPVRPPQPGEQPVLQYEDRVAAGGDHEGGRRHRGAQVVQSR